MFSRLMKYFLTISVLCNVLWVVGLCRPSRPGWEYVNCDGHVVSLTVVTLTAENALEMFQNGSLIRNTGYKQSRSHYPGEEIQWEDRCLVAHFDGLGFEEWHGD